MSIPSPTPPPPAPHRSAYADDPFMQPLIAEFIARLADHVRHIRDSVAADRADDLRRILHQLRGAGKSYGFPPISAHAADAEEKLKAGEPLTAIYPDLGALLDYIERIEGYIPS